MQDTASGTISDTGEIQWYHFGPSKVTPNKGFGPQSGETVYISEANGARNVKSDGLVAMNKNSDSALKSFSLGGGWGDSVPNLNLSNFWNCPKRVERQSLY